MPASPSPRMAAVGLLLELRSVPLFRELGAEQLRPLVEIAAHQSCAEGEVIFEPGDSGDRLFVIAAGRVELDGEGVLHPGACFGELSLVEPHARRRRARALTEVSLLTITQHDFAGVLASYPDIAQAVARVLAERLRQAQDPAAPPSRRF